ncbi:hypothetical protein C2W62_25330 [Candidatus Entotheonella serta]|nr:hypothetical protein C2W62_25330 [Candidatus Entotheonella serta]
MHSADHQPLPMAYRLLELLVGLGGLVLLTALFLPQLAHAQDMGASVTERSPHLVIETGAHRAIIRELIFTADGQELVSVSDDKTIRIWSVSSDGKQATLSRTLRGQIEDGRAGLLAAAALSPPDRTGQHRWLAVGGYLAGAPANRYAIRLHDYASGYVKTLLQGHTDIVLALAFSPDGRWLVSVGKDHTIRVWDVDAWQDRPNEHSSLVLKMHTQPIYDLAWSPSGERLASASDDHTIGLWDMTEGLAGSDSTSRTTARPSWASPYRGLSP